MKHIPSSAAILVLAMFMAFPAYAVCDETTSLVDRACQRVTDTWTQGNHDLYLPFHTNHLRFAYTREEIDSFREDTWGAGYGRSHYDASGNWDGLYGMSFLDSHSKPQHILGYGHQWMWGEADGVRAGLGYTVFLTARSNMNNYLPTPGILPIASINYRSVSVNATYVPPYNDQGNLLFFWAKLGFEREGNEIGK